MKMMVIPILTGTIKTTHKGLLKRVEDLEIRGQVEAFKNYRFDKIGQNTEKSPVDLRRLAVTKNTVKDRQLTLV